MGLEMYRNSTRNYSILLYLFAAFFFLLGLNAFESSAQTNLPITPSDAEGPFYPVIRQDDEDNDLIHVKGQENPAKGDVLHLTGKVVDTRGKPFSNATVEIWQTDTQGRYKDKRDTKPGERNPDFQYWGKATCNKDGFYSFDTLVPGSYHPRPAHIHFKVWIDGSIRLTSQIYFRKTGSLLNKSLSQRATPILQTVDLKKVSDGKYEAFFQIVLE